MGVEKDAKGIYDGNKNSVLLLKSCPFILSYPKYTLESDWDTYWGDQVWIYAMKEGTEPYEMEDILVPYFATGTGFVVDGKVISSAHLFDCDSEEIFEDIQEQLAALVWYIDENRELGESGYQDREYEEVMKNFQLYIDTDLDSEASRLLEFIKNNREFGDSTTWTEENVKDQITWALAAHIFRYGEISAVREGYASAYDLEEGYDTKYDLSLVGSGEAWPGEDYAILHLEDGDFKNLQIGDSDGTSIADDVFIVSYPGVADLNDEYFPEPTISQGIISSKKISSSGVEYIQTDLSASGGSSGGPVFDKYGRIIGILTAGDSTGDFNFLLPMKYVVEKLKGEIEEDILSSEWNWELEKEENSVDSEEVRCEEFISQNLPEYIVAEEAWEDEMILSTFKKSQNEFLDNVTWNDGKDILFVGESFFVRGKLSKDQDVNYFYGEKNTGLKHGTSYSLGNYFEIYELVLERIEQTNNFKIISYRPGVCSFE